MELSQGRMDQPDYERLKATDERRLLRILDKLDTMKAATHSETDEQQHAASKRTSWGSGHCIGNGSFTRVGWYLRCASVQGRPKIDGR